MNGDYTLEPGDIDKNGNRYSQYEAFMVTEVPAAPLPTGGKNKSG